MTEDTDISDTKRLRRSNDKRIAGVAGGIGEYFGVDPVVVRLALVVLVLFGGTGVLLYLVAWLVLPGPHDGGPGDRGSDDRGPVRSRSQAVLLAAAVLLILATSSQIFWIFGWGVGSVTLPFALLALAVALIMTRPDDSPAADTASGGIDTAADAGFPTAERAGEPFVAGPAPGSVDVGTDPASGSTAVVPVDDEPTVPVPVVAPRGGDGGTTPPDGDTAPETAPRPRPRLATEVTALTLASLAVFAGVAAAGDLADWWELSLVFAFSAALIIVGVAVAVSAFVGRAIGLTVLGVILAFGLVTATALDPIIDHGVGDREVVATDVDGLDAEYRLGVGRLVVDLSDLDLAGEAREVTVDLDIGEAIVRVPPAIEVVVDGEVTAGELDLFGQSEGGLRVERSTTIGERVDGSRLIVHLDVGAGRGEVSVGAAR